MQADQAEQSAEQLGEFDDAIVSSTEAVADLGPASEDAATDIGTLGTAIGATADTAEDSANRQKVASKLLLDAELFDLQERTRAAQKAAEDRAAAAEESVRRQKEASKLLLDAELLILQERTQIALDAAQARADAAEDSAERQKEASRILLNAELSNLQARTQAALDAAEVADQLIADQKAATDKLVADQEAATAAMAASWERFEQRQNVVVKAMETSSLSFGDLVELLADNAGVSVTEMAGQLQTMGIKFGDTMALIASMGESHLSGLISKFNSLQSAVAGATGAVSGASNSSGGTANPGHGTPPSIEAINEHNAHWDPLIAEARAAVAAQRALIASYTDEEWDRVRPAAISRLNYLKDRVGILVDQKNAARAQLAEGGIVTGPTDATIGEDGPEAVIPLPMDVSSLFTMRTPEVQTGNADDRRLEDIDIRADQKREDLDRRAAEKREDIQLRFDRKLADLQQQNADGRFSTEEDYAAAIEKLDLVRGRALEDAEIAHARRLEAIDIEEKRKAEEREKEYLREQADLRLDHHQKTLAEHQRSIEALADLEDSRQGKTFAEHERFDDTLADLEDNRQQKTLAEHLRFNDALADLEANYHRERASAAARFQARVRDIEARATQQRATALKSRSRSIQDIERNYARGVEDLGRLPVGDWSAQAEALRKDGEARQVKIEVNSHAHNRKLTELAQRRDRALEDLEIAHSRKLEDVERSRTLAREQAGNAHHQRMSQLAADYSNNQRKRRHGAPGPAGSDRG